jgi:glucosamine 6-phosphate synthetase-like amidotransferase/phosphosugar isomerase protein
VPSRVRVPVFAPVEDMATDRKATNARVTPSEVAVVTELTLADSVSVESVKESVVAPSVLESTVPEKPLMVAVSMSPPHCELVAGVTASSTAAVEEAVMYCRVSVAAVLVPSSTFSGTAASLVLTPVGTVKLYCVESPYTVVVTAVDTAVLSISNVADAGGFWTMTATVDPAFR